MGPTNLPKTGLRAPGTKNARRSAAYTLDSVRGRFTMLSRAGLIINGSTKGDAVTTSTQRATATGLR